MYGYPDRFTVWLGILLVWGNHRMTLAGADDLGRSKDPKRAAFGGPFELGAWDVPPYTNSP